MSQRSDLLQPGCGGVRFEVVRPACLRHAARGCASSPGQHLDQGRPIAQVRGDRSLISACLAGLGRARVVAHRLSPSIPTATAQVLFRPERPDRAREAQNPLDEWSPRRAQMRSPPDWRARTDQHDRHRASTAKRDDRIACNIGRKLSSKANRLIGRVITARHGLVANDLQAVRFVIHVPRANRSDAIWRAIASGVVPRLRSQITVRT